MLKRRIAASISRKRAASGLADSREFLERLAKILVRSGHSPRTLTREFQDICRTLKEPKQSWDAARLDFVADLPHVIAHWHADPQYLDSRGVPIPLPLSHRSRGPSLAELISRVLPNADPTKVVEALMQLRGLTHRAGLYRPTGRYLAYNQQTTSALAHGLKVLLGLLGTLEENSRRKRNGALLERAAMNPHFPVRALRGFHANLKQRAEPLLWDLDRDMRRHEQRAGSEPTTRLGVCVFAFEDPRFTGRRVRSRKGRTR